MILFSIYYEKMKKGLIRVRVRIRVSRGIEDRPKMALKDTVYTTVCIYMYILSKEGVSLTIFAGLN